MRQRNNFCVLFIQQIIKHLMSILVYEGIKTKLPFKNLGILSTTIILNIEVVERSSLVMTESAKCLNIS